MFWIWGRGLPIPDCYIRWNLGPSLWTGDKAVHGMTPSSISREQKKKKVPVRRQDHEYSLLGLPRSDSCGCDVFRGDGQFQCLHQNTYRTQVASQTSVVSQESNINLASAWQCKATHKFEDLGTHQKLYWTVLPHPPYSPDLAPSDLHLFGALKDAIWDWWWWWCDLYSGNFTIWAGQGMVLRKCTYTCSSVQGLGSEWRHYFLGRFTFWCCSD